MKKGRGIIWFSILFIIACGTVFYFGYTPLHLKKDCVGVFISKTSGVSPKAVENGVFSWHWQALIPTNSSLRCFSNKPYSYKTTKSGMLPGADVYSKVIKENSSFNYSLDISFELRANPSQFVQLVKDSDIATESELESKYREMSEKIVEKINSKIINFYNGEVADKILDLNQLELSIKNEFSESGFNLSDIHLANAKLPDYRVYTTAKNVYTKYMAEVQNEMSKLSVSQAREIAENTKNLSKLEKFGQVLRDYKDLSELLKSSKDLTETLKAIYAQN